MLALLAAGVYIHSVELEQPKKRHRARRKGVVYRRADQRWEAKFTVEMPDGRRVRKSLYAYSKDEAEEKLITALAALTTKTTESLISNH